MFSRIVKAKYSKISIILVGDFNVDLSDAFAIPRKDQQASLLLSTEINVDKE